MKFHITQVEQTGPETVSSGNSDDFVKLVFRRSWLEVQKVDRNPPENIRTMSGRNTASMFQRCPVFLLQDSVTGIIDLARAGFFHQNQRLSAVLKKNGSSSGLPFFASLFDPVFYKVDIIVLENVYI